MDSPQKNDGGIQETVLSVINIIQQCVVYGIIGLYEDYLQFVLNINDLLEFFYCLLHTTVHPFLVIICRENKKKSLDIE